jgi:dihydroflavonol-4-reductase
MRVLVTGATGFIGSHVARALIAGGASLRVVHRSDSPTELIDDLPADHVLGDILDPASLAAACDGVEAVVHCAAQMRGRGGQPARLESHLLGTRNMLAAAVDAGVRRFVYTSSVAALGIPPRSPAETAAEAPLLDETYVWHGDPALWPYGYAKHQAEQWVRQAAHEGLSALIVNPALVIGPGDRNRVSNILIWHILRGRVPPLIPGGLNVVAVEDVAAGTLAALVHGRAAERYILCGENWTLADLIRTTARLVGRRQPRLRLSLRTTRAVAALTAAAARWLRLPLAPELLQQAGVYFYYRGDKARRELALGPPRPYEPAALAAAEWYRHHRLR